MRVQYWEHMSSGHTKIKFTFHPAALESVPGMVLLVLCVHCFRKQKIFFLGNSL